MNCDEEKRGRTVTLSSPALTDTGRPLAAAYEELQEEIRGFTSGNDSALEDNLDVESSYANRRRGAMIKCTDTNVAQSGC